LSVLERAIYWIAALPGLWIITQTLLQLGLWVAVGVFVLVALFAWLRTSAREAEIDAAVGRAIDRHGL
jgi:hypothetical protein